MSGSPQKTHAPKMTIYHRLAQALDRWQPPAELILNSTALLVGLGAGLGAVVFRYLILGVEWLGYEWLPQITESWGKAYILIVPALGGLLVGPLVYFFAREAKGHGVPEVMEAVALKGGRIRPRVALVKSLASALSIGSGGSVGREGPIVQIGSALGSSLGQALNLSEKRIRTLVACGAAGGIAATFNAPIAGVIFALEIILGEITLLGFSSVVIASVAASVIGRVAFGDIPAFTIPFEYGITSLWEYAFYFVLGLLAAGFGVIYTRSLYWTEDLFDSWKNFPEWGKPAIGGALLGLVGLTYPYYSGVTWERIPHIFNVGYEVIEQALANQIVLNVAIVLLVLKLLATILTLGSGGSGGIFAPGLFMGAMLGAAFEIVLRSIFPNLVGPEGAYALVGMGAVFAATAHAPITAVLILFELTSDYQIILPLMLAVVVATLTSRHWLHGESIYSLKLSRRGIHIQSGRVTDVMDSVSVKDVMNPNPVTVNLNMQVSALAELFLQTNQHAFPILDDDNLLFGIVSLMDYRRNIEDLHENEELLVKDICSQRVVTAYPDETIQVVLQRMAPRDLSRIPVVSRNNQRKLLGIVRRNDIVKAYRLGTVRRGAALINLPGPPPGSATAQLIVSDNTTLIGKPLAKLKLPENSIIMQIQRDGEIILPRGNSQFQPGDVVTILVRDGDLDKFERYWQGLSKGSGA
jgi:CIC family chloride channel protein